MTVALKIFSLFPLPTTWHNYNKLPSSSLFTTKQTHNSDSSNWQTDSAHLTFRTLRMLFLLSSDLSTTTDRDRTRMNESSIISISTPPSALVTSSASSRVVVLDPYSPFAHPSWRSFRTASSVIILRYNYICGYIILLPHHHFPGRISTRSQVITGDWLTGVIIIHRDVFKTHFAEQEE